MNKILAAIVAGLVGVIAVFFLKGEGLVTEAVVRDAFIGTAFAFLAIIMSWVITLTVGSSHTWWARVLAFTICIAGGYQHWHVVSIGWLTVSILSAFLSPILFMVVEATLQRFGIKLRRDTKGVLTGVAIGEDPTIMLTVPKASSACPICKKIEPHSHTPEEIAAAESKA